MSVLTIFKDEYHGPGVIVAFIFYYYCLIFQFIYEFLKNKT